MRISDWSSDVALPISATEGIQLGHHHTRPAAAIGCQQQVPPARLPGGVDRPVRLVEDDSEGLVRAACRRQLHHLHAVEREAADGKPAGHEEIGRASWGESVWQYV